MAPANSAQNLNMDKATLQRMIDRAVQSALDARRNDGPPGPPGPPGVQGPTGPPGNSGGSNGWNASDLGYFDPQLDKSYGEGDIVTVGKDIYYRNVYLFVERAKDLATVKTPAIVRTNLNTCLRGMALVWYTTEMSNIERTGLSTDENGLEEWSGHLIKRFKESTGVALSKLTAEKCTSHGLDQEYFSAPTAADLVSGSPARGQSYP